ncbi:hypothetical protein [Agrobacterium sp.]|uniref:hypothetical protein n=1 Tax=Agrobacterium sp. TaxID=361 RepID=UPI0028AC1DA7
MEAQIYVGGSVAANANFLKRHRHLSLFLQELHLRFDCTAKIPSKQTFWHVPHDEIAQAEGKIAVRKEDGGHLAAACPQTLNDGRASVHAVPAPAFPQMPVAHLRVAVCGKVVEQFG